MEILENALKTIPGLALVFAVVALVLLENNSEVAATIRVFVVAWALYRISSYLDWFFDLVYGPGPRPGDQANKKTPGGWPKVRGALDEIWCRLRTALLPGFKNLEEKRDNAAERLHLAGVRGVYGKAKKAVEMTMDWKTKVDPLRVSSKAARAFIIPFLLIAGWDRLMPQWFVAFTAFLGNLPLLVGFRADFARAHEKLDFLRIHPAIPAVACLISAYLYLSRRLRHMNGLYDLVVERQV